MRVRLCALGFCRIDLDTIRIISVAVLYVMISRHKNFKLFLVPKFDKDKIITKISTI